jgi:phosphohistidine phosphatase
VNEEPTPVEESREETTAASPDEEGEAAPASRDRLVILYRHGIAEERTEEKPDEDRSLTKAGHSKMKKNAEGLAAVTKADVIFSSPLLRAVQTALWISKAYKRKVEIKTSDALSPSASFEDFENLLKESAGKKIIFVGHEPTLTRNMRMLTKLGESGELELKKGGCYGVRLREDGTATLEWILTPRLLRKLR